MMRILLFPNVLLNNQNQSSHLIDLSLDNNQIIWEEPLLISQLQLIQQTIIVELEKPQWNHHLQKIIV